MDSKLTKPELLAPAGNISCALAAFEAGADAVYCGLQKFNARERTDNFSREDLSKLMGYARNRGKKVYITFNTLIKENEIKEVATELSFLESMMPDALIVQDIGVIRMIRDYFPSLKIHASTQMGIHNSAGIITAKKMGIERIILERQVTHKEMGAIIQKSPLPVEVFIHGSLCCSLSGKCLFSSWLGGWSGNRGRCKQPCRRRYFREEGNGFFFSTKDLYGIELIADYKRWGVASLKIEGRLRKEDYARNTVAAYRLLLDVPIGEEKEVTGAAKRLLAGSPGRQWSNGFSVESEFSDLIQATRLGAQGLYVGKVAKTAGNGFSINLTGRIRKGDRLRIQPQGGEDGVSFVLTKLSIWNKPVNSAKKGDTVFISCDKEIFKEGAVYKTGESGLDYSQKIAKLPFYMPPLPVSLDINLSAQTLQIDISSGDKKWQWEKSLSLDSANKRAISKDDISSVFTATRDERIKPVFNKITIEGNLFFPAGELKAIRREFWEETLGKVDFSSNQTISEAKLQKFLTAYGTKTGGIKPLKDVESVEVIHFPSDSYGSLSNNQRKGTIASPLHAITEMTDEVILPLFCGEENLYTLKRDIRKAYKEGFRTFRQTALFQTELLKGLKDIIIRGGFPLPVTNSQAVTLLTELQFSSVLAWPELDKVSLRAFIEKSSLPLEVFRGGRLPILITRIPIEAEGELSDNRKHHFLGKYDKALGLFFLYPEEKLALPKVPGAHNYYDNGPKQTDKKDHRKKGDKKVDGNKTSTFNYELNLL